MAEAAEPMDEVTGEQEAAASPQEEVHVGGKRSRGEEGAPAPKKTRPEPEEEREAPPPTAAEERPLAPASPVPHGSPTLPPPADATNSIVVEGLRRPFTLGEIQELLAEHGSVQHFWISKNRSRCAAVFADVQAATSAFRALNGVTWPPKIGNALDVSFVSEATARASSDASEAVKPSTARRSVSPTPKARKSASPPRKEPVKETRPARESPARPAVSVDELFKKTSAKPALYWMPVGEEEAKANWENVAYDGHYNAKTFTYVKFPNRAA